MLQDQAKNQDNGAEHKPLNKTADQAAKHQADAAKHLGEATKHQLDAGKLAQSGSKSDRQEAEHQVKQGLAKTWMALGDLAAIPFTPVWWMRYWLTTTSDLASFTVRECEKATSLLGDGLPDMPQSSDEFYARAAKSRDGASYAR